MKKVNSITLYINAGSIIGILMLAFAIFQIRTGNYFWVVINMGLAYLNLKPHTILEYQR